MDVCLKCREAKVSEINLLVDAFRLTLLEMMAKNKDIDILPTERTLDSCRGLIFQSYERGYTSFVVETQDQILGYLVIMANNICFDLNKNIATILTLYVEPSFRHLNIAKFLIETVEKVLKAKGVNMVNTQVFSKRLRVLKRWRYKVIENLQIYLD